MNENMKQQMSHAKWLTSALLAASSLIGVGHVFAQDQVQAQVQIYGSQLMTTAERTEYQTKMRTLKTDSERDAFRLDHHTKMTTRATERGITLPSTPPGVGAGRVLVKVRLLTRPLVVAKVLVVKQMKNSH